MNFLSKLTEQVIAVCLDSCYLANAGAVNALGPIEPYVFIKREHFASPSERAIWREGIPIIDGRGVEMGSAGLDPFGTVRLLVPAAREEEVLGVLPSVIWTGQSSVIIS